MNYYKLIIATLICTTLLFSQDAFEMSEEGEIIMDEVVALDSSDTSPLLDTATTSDTPSDTMSAPSTDSSQSDQLDSLDTDSVTTDSTDSADTLAENPTEALPEIDKFPEQTHFEEATYPAELQKSGVEGDVLLELIVNDSGLVDSAWVLESLEPTLDSNAVAAALKFTFTPAMIGDTAIAVAIEYSYHYSLDEQIQELATQINFTGTLVERGTRTPLDSVLITLTFPDSTYALPVPLSTYLKKVGTMEGQFMEEGILATYTDSLGNFSFTSLPNGSFNLKIAHAGYETYTLSDSIVATQVTSADLFLRKVAYSDYEVVAYYKGEEKEVSRHQMTINEIKKIPGLGGDAIKVVQAMPGVARPTAGSGAIVVRGANTYDSKFYLDGADIPLLYHFGGLKSTYNSDALATIDFYPGGWGVTFGNAIGGVVDLSSRKPKDDRWHGIVDVSLLDAMFMVEGPIGDKVTVLATARRSYFGEIVSAVLKNPKINAPLTVTPFYWDYVARVEYAPSDRHRIYATTFGSFDSLQMHVDNSDLGSDEIATATDGVSQQLFFNRAGVGWDFDITPTLKNSFNYYFLFQKSKQGIFGFAKWDDKLREHQFRDNLGLTLTEKSAFNVGINGYASLYDMNLIILDANSVPKRDSIKDWNFSNIGVYANFEWKPSDKWLIIPGIRYDYYSELIPSERSNFSVRFMSRFNYTEGHTIKMAAGTYNQTPQPMGFVIHPTWGEETLPSTKASQTVLGYEWDITPLISLDVQGYFNYQWGIPRQQSSNDIDSSNVGGAQLWYPDQKGRTYGLEIMLRHHQSERFFGWLAYSLSRSERLGPYDNDWVLFGKDQTHNIQLLGSWKLNNNWEIGGRLRYVTGNPTTPIDSTSISVDGHRYTPHYGITNSTREGSFFQMDLRAEKKIIFKRTVLSIYLDIQNLLYFVYASPEFEFYDNFYEQKQSVSMPIIPALGVRFEF